ncbi:MAG: cell division protein [Rhodospirillales bacterium]|nr:cell division protein [Rhodospirillales bacterium]
MIRRTDLPLDRDAHARFLPWLIAFMVYLAVLALAGVLVVNRAVERWDTGISGTLTVQIMPSARDVNTVKQALNDVMEVLDSTPGVVHSVAMTEDRILELLEPWLGDLAHGADLPIPQLIDVTIDPDAGLDVAALGRRLAIAAPGATVDDHRVWLDRLVRLLRTIEMVAMSIVGVIGMVTIGTVVFTTRTGLAIHSEAIQVLHLIGAHDAYVARQFAGRALVLGLKGGLIGLFFAAPTLMAIGYFGERMQLEALPVSGLGLPQVVVLVMMPLIVALIAMLTARVTVLRTLARMP